MYFIATTNGGNDIVVKSCKNVKIQGRKQGRCLVEPRYFVLVLCCCILIWTNFLVCLTEAGFTTIHHNNNNRLPRQQFSWQHSEQQQQQQQRPSTILFTQVASDFIRRDGIHDDNKKQKPHDSVDHHHQHHHDHHQHVSQDESQSQLSPTRKKFEKLSRPERKALERAKKQQQGKKRTDTIGKVVILHTNETTSTTTAVGGGDDAQLHSTTVLTCHSTADQVLRAIKRAQNQHGVTDLRTIARFVIHETPASFAYGYKGSLLARLAVAALHLNDHETAATALNLRRTEYRPSMLPLESAAIVRGLLRVHNVSDAMSVLEDELSLPMQGTALTDPASKDRLKWRALALASIASRHFFEGEPAKAVASCLQLSSLGPMVREAGLTVQELNMPWERILQGAAQCETQRRNGTLAVEVAAVAEQQQQQQQQQKLPCNLVYPVLNAMTEFPPENSDRVYEILSNALVRRVIFITGAISMDGCPKADRGEAAFIGRSNVGKSSLVNMITNRKSLAFISKRPGKTQQFNFFAVNDKPEREREIKYGDVVPGSADADSFYMVDLPGFGYAKVPTYQKEKWAAFMEEYICHRPTLRVLFHLIDARLGPTKEDANIMKMVANKLAPKVQYVLVLTKADKNVRNAGSTTAAGKVSSAVMDRVRACMKEANDVHVNSSNHHRNKVPIILSSAETKLGRDDLWRYLRLAAEK